MILSAVKVQDLLQEYLSKYNADKNERHYASYHFFRYLDTLKQVPEAGTRALEIGVGFGHLAYLVKRLYRYEVTGLDLKDDCAVRLNKEGIIFKRCELTKGLIPFVDRYFDLVLFCETVEHLTGNIDRALAEIYRILRSGGTLIVTTPNKLRIRRLFQWRLFNRFNIEHYREYSPSEITNLLLNGGFRMESFVLSDCWTSAVTHRKAEVGIVAPIFYYSSFLSKAVPLLRDCCMIRARKLENTGC